MAHSPAGVRTMENDFSRNSVAAIRRDGLAVDESMQIGSSRLAVVSSREGVEGGVARGPRAVDDDAMLPRERTMDVSRDTREEGELVQDGHGKLGGGGAEFGGVVRDVQGLNDAGPLAPVRSTPASSTDQSADKGAETTSQNEEFVGLGLSTQIKFEQETSAITTIVETSPLGRVEAGGNGSVGVGEESERNVGRIESTTPPRPRRVASNDGRESGGRMSPQQLPNPPSPKLVASPSRGPRSFLTNLLSRATSPRIPPPSLNNSSRTTPPSPTLPPSSRASLNHMRSSSMPISNRAAENDATMRNSMEPTRVVSPVPSPTIGRAPLPSNEDAEEEDQFLSAPAPNFESNPSTPTAHPESSSTKTTLASIGLSLHALTPPLPLARNFSALCGVILDDVLLIGTANGLYFLPLPTPGAMIDMGKGKGGKRERKPIALIKRTRFAQLAVLGERSNILLAIAGKNSHIRVYTLDGIRALIERRLNDYDPNVGYAMKCAVTLAKKPRPNGPLDKGKSRHPPLNITTSRGISSSDYFARGGPVSPPPEYDSLPRRRPSSINYSSFAGSMSAAGASAGGSGGGTPRMMRSRASSSGSIVRAVSTVPSSGMRSGVRGSTSTIRGSLSGDRVVRGSIETSEAEEEVVEEEIIPNEPVDVEPVDIERNLGIVEGGTGLIRSISSTSSTTGSEWATDQGSPTLTRPAIARSHTPSDSQHSSPLIPSSSSFVPRENESIFANFEGFNSTVSPSLSLTEFVEGLAGEEREGEDSVSRLPPLKMAREPSVPKLPTGILSPALELARMFRETGPEDTEEESGGGGGGVGETSWEMVPDEPVSPSFGRLEPREASTRRASYRDSIEEEDTTTPSGERQFSFAQAIRDGPPIAPPALHTSHSSRSVSSLQSNPPPSPRTASKRWSITGVGSLFNRANFVPAEISPTTLIPPSGSSSSLAGPSNAPPPVREREEPSRLTDVKRKPAPSAVESPVTLPPSTTLLGEDHTHISSPLEYVKLARTKGARYLRAVETKKRTFLAVLVGDQGERIELFTGSRGTSLALNRTFVLPQTPSIIDFQMLGDELLDLYLVYPDSIFALEPQSVRVREVGIGRSERRTRRERERRMQNIASTSTAEPVTPGVEGEESEPRLAPEGHPADRNAEENDRTADNSRANSPLPPAPRVEATSPTDEPTTGAPAVPPRGATTLPYTTFQQLSFVPPVPSSVLAPAWTIPPLYESHLSTVPTTLPVPILESTSSSSACPPEFSEAPLLSPVSLLGGASQQATGATGPPQLFFVCKGKSLAHIVTGDGRSVIKRPILFNNPTPSLSPDDIYNRIEILIVGGKQTVIIASGPFGIKAVTVEEETGLQQALFGMAIEVEMSSVSKLAPRENGSLDRNIQFLGMDSSNQYFFSERLSGSGSWGVFCLSAV